MNCPNCGQPVEQGAAFCGNCGQPLQVDNSVIAQVMDNQTTTATDPNAANYNSFGHLATSGAAYAVPAYALAKTPPHSHVKITLALVCGIVGAAGAAFIPILGIVLGIVGLILATTALHSSRGLKVAAILVPCIAIVAGLASWAYVINHSVRLHPNTTVKPAAASTNVITAVGLSTPCYSLSFPEQLNIDNTSGSCEMEAFNGATFDDSSNVYKVLTTTATTVTAADFNAVAKKAIEADVAENLPSFSITSEGSGTFAGSPAYFVNAANTTGGVAVEEGAVLRSSAAGTELFVLVHATNGATTNLSDLEANWQWK